MRTENWSALGMARVLILAPWPKEAKEAFSEKGTPGASQSYPARHWSLGRGISALKISYQEATRVQHVS